MFDNLNYKEYVDCIVVITGMNFYINLNYSTSSIRQLAMIIIIIDRTSLNIM